MARHQDHRDVTLTETGRQSGTRSTYQVNVGFESDSATPNMDAEIRFRITDGSATDDVTEHEIRLFSQTSPPARAGSLFWRRNADESRASESPRCENPTEVHVPASVGGATVPSLAPADTWQPELAKSDAWSFLLEVWTEQRSGFTVSLTNETKSRTDASWKLSITDNATGQAYTGHLVGKAVSDP